MAEQSVNLSPSTLYVLAEAQEYVESLPSEPLPLGVIEEHEPGGEWVTHPIGEPGGGA
jgi:hypothetical protein